MTPETMAWIEQQKPTLVVWAEDFVRSSKLYLNRESDPEPDSSVLDDPNRNKRHRQSALVSSSQLRNLLNAAQQGTALRALVNFLRYQVGRGSSGWRHGSSAKKLEEMLLGKLKDLCAKGATDRATEDAETYALEAQMSAQLLGFIIREYTYRCELAGTKS